MAAWAVVGVGGAGGGVVLALPLPAGLLTMPWPQPLRMRSVDNESARSFRIILEASEVEKMRCAPLLGFDMAEYVNRSLTSDELTQT
jgi:hypothetical protein